MWIKYDMVKPYSGCSGSEWHTYSPPYLSPWVLGAFSRFLRWVEYNIGTKFFVCQKFLLTSRNAPMCPKRFPVGPKMVKKFSWNWIQSYLKTEISAKKTCTWVSGDFLGPKVTTPKFGSRQKVLRFWAYFWKFVVANFFSEKF